MSGETAPPYYTYYMTFRCNLHCAMCYQRAQRRQLAGELSLKEATGMFDKITHLERVNLIGGEVFVRPDALDLLEYFDGRGVITYVTTNGTLLDEAKIERLLALRRLLGVTVSLDALGDTYRSIRRGRSGAGRILEVIRRLAGRTEVRVNSVLLAENAEQFGPLVEAVAEAGASMLKVQLQIAHSPWVVDCTEQCVQEWMGFPVPCLYPREIKIWDVGLLRTAIQDIRQAADGCGLHVRIFPGELLHHLDEYAAETLWRNWRLDCEGFTHIPRLKVFPDGEVIFCEGLGLSLGNLQKQPVDQIWNSPALRTFRRHFERAGGLPICGRCCRVVVGSKRAVPEKS